MPSIPTQATPHEKTTKSANMESTLVLGHSAAWWDAMMLLSLAVAAFVAIAVAGATIGSVAANKREAAAANLELEHFKADAEARIAAAQQATESLRSENLRLEAKIQPRRLLKEQLVELANSLEKFKGHKIRVSSYVLDAEGEVFASQLRDGLKSVFKIDDWVGHEEAENGFTQGINVTGGDPRLVEALVGALKKQGLGEVISRPAPPPRVVLIAASISREKAKDVAAEVLIGIKPIEQ